MNIKRWYKTNLNHQDWREVQIADCETEIISWEQLELDREEGILYTCNPGGCEYRWNYEKTIIYQEVTDENR